MELGNIIKKYLKYIVLWGIGAVTLGAVTGAIGGAFALATNFVTGFRQEHFWVLFLLPIGAFPILWLYKRAGYENDEGVNKVIKGVTKGENVPFRIAPLIFFAATLSHFCGASVGRVGTSLQIGGSLGDSASKIFKLSKKNRIILILCGMSGVFSGFFGTPLAAAIFSLELVVVGKIYYQALFPSIICSFTARYIGILMGVKNAGFNVVEFPTIGAQSIGLVALLALIAGLVTILYCVSIQKSKILAARFIKNPYLRAIIFGGAILLLTILVGNQTYNGIGGEVVIAAFSGSAVLYGFLLKILFTSLSGAAGYRGGDVFPAIYIGASLGAAFGNLMGFEPSFMCAIGVCALFCGITKCPLTTFIISIELFGAEGALFYIIAIGISFVVSGPRGIFQAQEGYPLTFADLTSVH